MKSLLLHLLVFIPFISLSQHPIKAGYRYTGDYKSEIRALIHSHEDQTLHIGFGEHIKLHDSLKTIKWDGLVIQNLLTRTKYHPYKNGLRMGHGYIVNKEGYLECKEWYHVRFIDNNSSEYVCIDSAFHPNGWLSAYVINDGDHYLHHKFGDIFGASNELIGHREMYDSSGQMTSYLEIRDEKNDWERTDYLDGQPSYFKLFNDSLQIRKSWHPNGQLERDIRYDPILETGRLKTFNQRGRKTADLVKKNDWVKGFYKDDGKRIRVNESNEQFRERTFFR